MQINGNTTLNATITVPTAVVFTQSLTGSGTLRMAAPLTWSGGTLALTGGLEILAGQTAAVTGGLTLNTGTSFKNFGTINWASPASFSYNGGSITVRNEAGGVWNLNAGSFTLATNGAPTPAGSFSFVNAGTMQGAGNPATTLTVSTTWLSFSQGTTNNMAVNLVP